MKSSFEGHNHGAYCGTLNGKKWGVTNPQVENPLMSNLKLSSVQNPGWLFDIRDEIVSNYIMEIIMSQYKDPYKPIRIQWFWTVAGKASRWPNALQLLELRGADAFAISAGIGDEPRKCLWVAGRKKGQGAKCQWNYHERENTGWNLEWFQ